MHEAPHRLPAAFGVDNRARAKRGPGEGCARDGPADGCGGAAGGTSEQTWGVLRQGWRETCG